MKTNKILTALAMVLASAVLVVLLSSTTNGAQSSQSPRIATVNGAKLFEKYYKKGAAEAAMDELAQGFVKQANEMKASVKKASAEYRELLDRSNDQASSAGEREKNKQAAETKLREAKDLDQAYQEFGAAAKSKLDEKKSQFGEKMLGEIKEAVAAKARAGSYTLVLDTAAAGANQAPAVLYSDGENDLTDAVLDQLNAAAPAASGSGKPPLK